jgi:hypothetical protein
LQRVVLSVSQFLVIAVHSVVLWFHTPEISNDSCLYEVYTRQGSVQI